LDNSNQKKGIIENFQTKLNGKTRLQHTQEGDVVVHYNQKQDEDGSLLIEATKSHKDLVKAADKNQRRRDANNKGKKFNLIKDGVQVKVSQQTTSVVGKHKQTTREKVTKTGKGLSFPNFDSSTMFFFEAKTELTLVGRKSKNNFLKKFLKPGFDDQGNEEGEINYQALNIESLIVQDLGLSKHLIKKLDNDNKKKLKQGIDFEQLLDQIYDEIAHKSKKGNLVDTLGKALDYAKNVKKKSYNSIKKRITLYYKKKKLSKVEIEYVKTLSTMLSTIGTGKAQKLLVKGLKFKSLRFNTLIGITSLKKTKKKYYCKLINKIY